MARKKRDPFEAEIEYEIVSKTEMKRDMDKLQKLGEELVMLPIDQLDKFELDETVLDAITLAQKLKGKHEAFRRQLQFIGKALRMLNPTDIEATLDKINSKRSQSSAEFYVLENTRDTLVAEGISAINELMQEYPHLDRQKLRSWVRTAQKDAEKGIPSKAGKELFRYLREELE
ncbi:ribosome biogenesis factor YjgA [Paraferrimonas sp. SM1919]|uniref:ribosome biogenesis factor YjgA n=1 Tax=Paraferrimonas sp. SM1919 TaxID=2662263 RepID=UPI0013D3571A|nr:ribosome biogenesis factor YjgA [Paraferrimonas sp. SM1919]